VNRPRYITTRVCAALNEAGAHYLVIGGIACILHGHVRATTDIDILIERTPENAARILDALSKIGYGFASESLPAQILAKPVTIIGDDPRVDIFTVAWSVKYAEAIVRSSVVEVEGISVPLLGLDDLIVTKKDTGRALDAADVEVLEKIRQKRAAGP